MALNAFEDLLNEKHLSHVADSRLVTPGSVFYALRGLKVDGHDFLHQAKQNGAVCAVVDKEIIDPPLPLIYVENVLLTLQLLAKRCVDNYPEKMIIGVTGSCGKTTTKEFIATLLEQELVIEKSPLSWNSQVTMPLCILNLLPKADILVLEMAMSQKGEIARLAELASPQIVVLTPITYAHSAFFSDIEEIASAKAEIFTSKRLAKAFIHQDALEYVEIQKKLPSSFEIFGYEENGDILFKERHMVENVVAAIKVAKHLKVSDEGIKKGLKELKTAPHRFDKKLYKGAVVIDDSYNANPKSMVAALENMPKPKEGNKRIALLGSMAELGAHETMAHQLVAKKALETIDVLLCVGSACKVMFDLFQANGKKAFFFENYEEMKRCFHEIVEENDVVLLKGSNKHKLWTMLDQESSISIF
ncbi:MAG: UDP-N-acetylmuramoyl-tripeptide--D-alanyl-D-alanine ligase [Chlamydiae bacterium]|nr:UDP-N-acetylmuramoyl-tripeptide--D-alanyl-D-alanine ligase [Chlamydiota bacterium]